MGPLGIGWARMSRHRDHPLPASFRIGPVLTRAAARLCLLSGARNRTLRAG